MCDFSFSGTLVLHNHLQTSHTLLSNLSPLSVEDALKTAREVYRSNRARLRNEMKARLMENTLGSSNSPEQMNNEHSYFRVGIDDNVVYYLSECVVHKVSKHTEGQLCLQAVSPAFPVVDAYLTTYRSFKEGSLKHLTKMLQFIRVANDSFP